MKTVNVTCPVCKERGRIPADDVRAEHDCPNCRQRVRLIPENSTTRKLKFILLAIPLALIILWACHAIWQKVGADDSTSAVGSEPWADSPRR